MRDAFSADPVSSQLSASSSAVQGALTPLKTELFDGRPLTTIEVGGTKIFHQPSPQRGVASLKIAIPVTVLDETNSSTGFRHAAEHFYSKLFLERAAELGLSSEDARKGIHSFAAHTDIDSIVFSWWGSEANLGKALMAFQSFLPNPLPVPGEVFRPEMSRIQVEHALRRSSFTVRATEDLAYLCLPGSLHTKSTLGSLDDLSTITAERVSSFLAAKLQEKGLVISMAGGDPREALPFVTPNTLPAKEESGPNGLSTTSQQNALFRYRPGPVVGAAVGFAIPGLVDPRHVEFEILADMMHRILAARLREDLGAVYGNVHESRVEGRESGLYAFVFESNMRSAAAAIQTIKEVAGEFAEGRFSHASFKAAKERFSESVAYSSSTSSSAAGLVLDRALKGAPFTDFGAIIERIEQTQRKDLEKFAKETLPPEALKLIIYGPNIPNGLSDRVINGKPFYGVL